MPTGIVKWFDYLRGYGVILPDDGTSPVYVSADAIGRSGLSFVYSGQRLQYELDRSEMGRIRAANLRAE